MQTSAGVYKIEHIESGRAYFGSAVNIHRRLVTHKWNLNKKSHSNKPLQNAWNTHGAESFVFKPVLICAKKDLLFYEQLLMDAYRSYIKPHGYNVRKKAESNAGLEGKKLYGAGDKFGKLTLVERIDNLRCNFLCYCGKECVLYLSNVVHGNTTSCGCFRREHFSKMKTQYNAGDKFNNWTLVRLHERKAACSNIWLCKCDCGTEKLVIVRSVVKGRSKSCGCKKGYFISKTKRGV